MIVSWKWLSDLVALDCTHEEFARRMMLAGFNHEETVPAGSDFAIDLEITSNRPDCLGQIGLAREASVLFGKELKLPTANPTAGKTAVESLAKITLEAPDMCPQYTARVIKGVKVASSPAWLVERLATLGIASINNIVDITNYVLMESGQPLHAFDYAKLAGHEIIIRSARAGEKIEAINHKAYNLEPGMLVIADKNKPVALAGVMGGADTEVGSATVDVLIESAEFDPLTIRTTARKLALHSDSSYRFERGLDPRGVEWASRRCCELILQLAGGELASGVVTVGRSIPSPEPVTLRLAQIPRILGIDVAKPEVERILRALGLEIKSTDAEKIVVTSPSWRRDLSREIDLIEEVARIHGYDQIPEDRAVPLVPSSRTRRDRVVEKLQTVLVGSGYYEALTLSAVDDQMSDAFSPWSDAPSLQSATPVLRRATNLRRSLVPSLLTARRTNETLANPRIELFEIAKVYWAQAGNALAEKSNLPQEELMLGLTSGGDFFAVKGIVVAMLDLLHPGKTLQLKPFNHPLFSKGRGAELWLDDERLGFLGEVSKAGQTQFELRGAATVAELRIAPFDMVAELIPTATELSPFPSVERDINLVVDEQIRWADVEKTILANAGPLLEQLQYQETYRDKQRLGPGKKSLLFSLLLRDNAATLTSAAADGVRDSVVAACGKAHAAALRT